MAQQTETTVDKHSMVSYMSARFPDGFPKHVWDSSQRTPTLPSEGCMCGHAVTLSQHPDKQTSNFTLSHDHAILVFILAPT